MCERAEADYTTSDRSYSLNVFGRPILADTVTCTFKADSPESAFLLTKTAYFSRLSILQYLLCAQKIQPTGKLVSPTDLKTGQIYFKGSHLLPMEQIAARFSVDLGAFLKQGARFGGEARAYGDAAVEMRAFPRVPITLILWQEDDEFPARSYLLFDETCEQHLPPDIVWSVAMMGALAMLKG